MAYIDPKALEAAGFTDEVRPRAASAVISVAGLEGTGKTTWSLTAPKPLFYQSTDFGDDGIIQKASGQIIRPRRGTTSSTSPTSTGRSWTGRKAATSGGSGRGGSRTSSTTTSIGHSTKTTCRRSRLGSGPWCGTTRWMCGST